MNLDQVILWSASVLVQLTLVAAIALGIAGLLRHNPAQRYGVLCASLWLALATPLIALVMQASGRSLLSIALLEESAGAIVEEAKAPATELDRDAVAGGVERPFPQTISVEGTAPAAQPFATGLQMTPDGPDRGVEPATVTTPHERTERTVAVGSQLLSPAAPGWLGITLRVVIPPMLLIWLLGTVFHLGRFAFGWRRLILILRRAQPISCPLLDQAASEAARLLGVAHLPALAVSPRVHSPIAAGLWRPCVVFPESLVSRITAAELRDILIHEMAHIVRRDQAMVLVQNFAESLFWAHPIVRRMNRLLAQAREEVCDNHVLSASDAPSYSRTLLRLAESMQQSCPLPAVGLLTSHWRLENRVAALLDKRRSRLVHLTGRDRLLVVALSLVMTALAACGTITLAQPPGGQDAVVGDAAGTKQPGDARTTSAARDERGSTAPAAKSRLSYGNDFTLNPGAFTSVRGIVLDADGHPIAGAEVSHQLADQPERRLAAGADGTFGFDVPAQQVKHGVRVAARADGFGPDWTYVLRDETKLKEVTLRLPKDDVPINGRILDLEGRPVKDAVVQAVLVGKVEAGQIVGWVEQNIKWLASHDYAMELNSVPAELAGIATATSTGQDGRFRLSGIGRDRAVALDVRGPGIERRRIWVATLSDPPAGLADVTGLYGATFKHLAGPARAVAGTVTDRQTGKPLPGIRVVGRVPRMGYARGGAIEAITDEEGRYRLDGLPKSETYTVTVDPLAGLTYLPQEKALPDTVGLAPLEADFALVRGTVVEGQLLDRDSGEPVEGRVRYYPLPGNEQFPVNGTQFRGELATSLLADRPVGGDGRFRLLVFPGPGVICAAGDYDTYVAAPVAAADAELGVGQNVIYQHEEVTGFQEVNGHAYGVVRATDAQGTLTLDLKLVRGRIASGTLSAPPGARPGIEVAEFRQNGAYDLPVRVTIDEKGDTFVATGFNPHRPTPIVFYHQGSKLAGFVLPSGEMTDPVAVQLQPWGTVRGRVLLADGRPAVGATVQPLYRDAQQATRLFATGPLSKRIPCDEEGRFQVEGLVPGLPFELKFRFADGPYRSEKPVLNHVISGGPTKPGQMNDIGDVKMPTYSSMRGVEVEMRRLSRPLQRSTEPGVPRQNDGPETK